MFKIFLSEVALLVVSSKRAISPVGQEGLSTCETSEHE